MKIAFTCHIIYDCGKRKMEPSINEALANIKRGNVDVELIPIWFKEPTIILTNKNAKVSNLQSKKSSKN